ncbi:hypothetical protein U0355_09815 [Salimicrobium sp. PL1-032A]|uniref:hypothetical protein n=1 Tax=Salimicrobium sp. PL1-032A TaxID=3095364 RepID=UPI003260A932
MSSKISLFSSSILPLLIFIFLFKAVQEGAGSGAGYLFAAALLVLLAGWKSILTIEEASLTRRITLFGKDVHVRHVSPEHIKGIKFRRAGWKSKRAVIETGKGGNLYIGQAEEEVMRQLESFAERHELPRDYAVEYKWL